MSWTRCLRLPVYETIRAKQMDWSNCSLSTQRRSVSQIGSMNGKSIFEEGGEEIDSSTVFSKATLKRREKKHLRQSGVEEATIESQSTELEVLSNKPDSKQGKKKERKKNGLSTKAESKAAAEKPEDKCMKHHSSLLPNAEHETESLDALRLSGEKGRKVNQASNMVSSVATVSNTRRGGKVSESRIVQESSRQKTDRALKLNVRASKKVSQEALPGVGSAQAAMHVDECQVQVKQQKKKLGTIREDENPETVKAAQEGKEAAELYVSSQERQLAGNSSRKGKGKKKQRKVSFQSKKERSEEDAEKFSKSQRPVEIALVSSVAPAVTSAIRLAKKGELQSCKTRYFYTGETLTNVSNIKR